MSAAADRWRIARLRTGPRRRRLDEVLLRQVAGAGTGALSTAPGVAERVAELEAEVRGLRLELAGRAACGHVLFLAAPDGYEIVESDEPPPPVEQLLLLERGCYRVLRAGRSPFPGDRRPCLFLEPA